MGRGQMEALGQRIRRLRQERGMTQAQLGQPVLTEAYISLIESNKRRPSQDALIHLAKQLDVDPDELASGRPAGLQVELELALQDARRQLDKGEVKEALRIVKRVRLDAAGNGLNRIVSQALELRGLISQREEGPDKAIKYYERALEGWEREPIHLRAETIAALAWCEHQLGQPRLAIHQLQSYLRDLESSGKADPAALVRTHSALVDPYFAAGVPEKAAESAREALRLESRVDNPEQVACMHVSVARSLYHDNRFDDALASLRKAQDIYLAGGWRNRAAKAQINEAIVLAKKEDYEPARGKLLTALETLQESPNRLDEALTLNELAYVSRHLGDEHAALSYLEQARPLLEDGDVIERAFNERELGLCLAESDPEVAERHFKRAIDLYRVEGAAQELATTFKELGRFYAGRGDTDRALQAFEEGLSAVEERSA